MKIDVAFANQSRAVNVQFNEQNQNFAGGFQNVYVAGGISFETDETLTLENGILSVNTANDAEENNTLPITSAAVYAEIGNINALLETI